MVVINHIMVEYVVIELINYWAKITWTHFNLG